VLQLTVMFVITVWSVRTGEGSGQTDLHEFSCVGHSHEWPGEDTARWEGEHCC